MPSLDSYYKPDFSHRKNTPQKSSRPSAPQYEIGLDGVPVRSSGGNGLPKDYKRAELLASGQIYGGLPSDYKETELAAGQKAEDFRKGAGFPGQTPTVEVSTRNVPKANGAKGTQTSPGGGMPTLTAAGIAQILTDRKIAPGAFSSIQLPGTTTNPDSGMVPDAIPFGGQETSFTTNTLGAFYNGGIDVAAIDPSVFTKKMPANLTSQFSQFGGMSLGNGAPTSAPAPAQGGKGYTEIKPSDPMFAKAFGQDLADKQNKGNTSRLNEALSDTASMRGPETQEGLMMRANAAFLNAKTAQEGLRAKEAVLGQFHTAGQTYQLNDAGTELIQQDGKPRAMDKAAASSYRLGTSTAEQYKNSYKDAVKEVVASEIPATPAQAQSATATNPVPVSKQPINTNLGPMIDDEKYGQQLDSFQGMRGVGPVIDNAVYGGFLEGNREPLMRDPRKN